jgi:uroporphyrinogen-III synthase
MSRGTRRPTVAILAATNTLPGVEAALRAGGVRPIRLRSIDRTVVPWVRWGRRLSDLPAPDTVVVLSPFAVDAGLLPWIRSRGGLPRPTEYWVAGPQTARRVRREGLGPVRVAAGAEQVLRRLRVGPRRSIVYFRSDAAGPTLARRLRSLGHRVVDPVVYRVRPAPPFGRRQADALRAARAVLVTSPSGVEALARRLGRRILTEVKRHSHLVVMGPRSRQAARAVGFQRVTNAGTTDAQRLTVKLLSAVRNASTDPAYGRTDAVATPTAAAKRSAERVGRRGHGRAAPARASPVRPSGAGHPRADRLNARSRALPRRARRRPR